MTIETEMEPLLVVDPKIKSVMEELIALEPITPRSLSYAKILYE